MKKCCRCGTDNAALATECSQCGSTEFKPAEPTVIAHEKPGKPTRLYLRILVAIGVWVAVSGLSLYVAWDNIYDAVGTRIEQFNTQDTLRNMAETIEKHHASSGAYPQSISELRAILTNDLQNDLGSLLVLDGWQRPYIFSLTGSNCLVTSYGRDGKPGGKGLDCDLTTRNWNPVAARPTFFQFLFEMDLTGVVNSCLVCGGMAGLLALLTVKIPDTSRQGLIILAVQLAVTIFAACWVATIISILHIPSGH